MRVAIAILLLGLIGGCSSDTASGPAMTMTMEVTLESGQEDTFCRYFVVPEGGIDIGSFEHAFTDVSHHLLLYPTALSPAAVTDEIFRGCDTDDAVRDSIIGVMYASQSAEETAAFPKGVAMEAYSQQVFLLEYHAINASDAAVDARVDLHLYEQKSPITAEAGNFFFYNWLIAVEPGERYTAKMSCPVSEDITLSFALMHAHKLGNGFRSWVTGGDLTEPLPLVFGADWLDDETVHFDPEIEIKAGQRIEFECDYFNSGAQPIIEGLSATDNEMCVFSAGYYNLSGPRLLFDDEWCEGIDRGPIMTGTATCQESIACVDAVDDDAADSELQNERCWAGTCEAASMPFRQMQSCRWDSCKPECPEGQFNSSACQSCLAASCQDRLDACLNTTCP
jgi:hypothetical protein